MGSFGQTMQEYTTQLQKGDIQKAYRGLMEFMLALRTNFAKKFREYTVSGSLYPGYMDMTYFAVIPPALKERGLKVAIVYLHESGRFEVWLSAVNKLVQQKYWQLFKEGKWNKYRIVPTLEGADSILEEVLAGQPDFDNLPGLTDQIEHGTIEFIGEIEKYLQSL